MKLTPIQIDLNHFPNEFHSLLNHAKLYDSSSSENAKVYFIDNDEGYFLKSAAQGTLQREAEMTRYFHQKGLATEVLSYISTD